MDDVIKEFIDDIEDILGEPVSRAQKEYIKACVEQHDRCHEEDDDCFGIDVYRDEGIADIYCNYCGERIVSYNDFKDMKD